MRKGFALVLVLVFLTASCVMVAKPVYGKSAVGNTWIEKAPMPTARGGLGVAVVNGKIYAIGGTTEQVSEGEYVSGGVVGTNEEYDPTTDTWYAKAPMLTPEAFFAIAVYQNKIYCIGGIVGSTGVNQVYDPATDTWGNKAPMPTARYDLQPNVLNGKIYCIGGITSNGATGVNEVYDPTTDTWTTKSALPTVTDIYSPSAVFNNKIYVFCGFSNDINNQIENFQLTQIYDPETDNWSSGTPPPEGVYGVAVATVGVMAPERIYILCGGGANQIYDPENNTWTLGVDIPANGQGQDFAAAVVNDTIYVIGGRIWTYPIGGIFDEIYNDTPSAVNEQYTPTGYGTPDPSYVIEHTPPKISVLSPFNQTYKESNVTLVFSLDKAVNWTGYSLDGQQNVTISGNSTIADVANGLHSITVYANDTYGNGGASETVSFTIAKSAPFPTATVAAVSGVAVVVVVGVGLLVYFKKHKR